MANDRADEIALQAFLRTAKTRGVHLVTASDFASLSATALLGKALRRTGIAITNLMSATHARDIATDDALRSLAHAPALMVIGAQLPAHPLLADVPQFTVDVLADEPISARALRLAESFSNAADSIWLAALGLIRDRRPHVIVERALARHTREELERVSDLLVAAARGPMPGMMTIVALELLIAAPEPRRFLAAEPTDLLRRCQAVVTVELAMATRLRPRAGRGVLVVEYDSACRIEDMVAARWRGLRPSCVVLVANHGWVEGHVAVVAGSASRDALMALPIALDSDGNALLTSDEWTTLLARLRVPPAPIVPADAPQTTLDVPLENDHAPLVN